MTTDQGNFTVGETLIVNGRNDDYDGKEAIYVDNDGGGGRHHVTVNGEDLYFYERHLTRPVETDIVATPVEPAIITDLQAEIDKITKDRDQQIELRRFGFDRLRTARDRYTHDMGVIERIMRGQKQEQRWCDDGYNSVVQDVNSEMQGGYEFEEFRALVRKTVSVHGETTTSVEVWVHEGDDADDTDNWRDEEGGEISDPDEFMQQELQSEFRRVGEFDTVEVQ